MLLGNGALANRSPLSQLSGGGWQNFVADHLLPISQTSDSGFGKLAGIPRGYRNPYQIMLPIKAGYVASRDRTAGVATASATIIQGRPIVSVTAAGVATVTGTAQLVVSGSGTIAGTATATGNIVAALGGVGASAGVATASADITAKAWGTGTINGVATTSAVRYATGQLAGSIAPAVTLEAASFSTYLLDEEDIETGLTLRKALRLVAAATAGKISGASGTTITIRNPVADSKDRIVATVDVDGNRSAFTYDLD
jgi:hypothetical protein